MRRTFLFLVIMAALVCPLARAQSRVSASISIGDQGLRGFYLGIGNYYHVPERQVMVVRERSIPDDELPVVFFLAQRARVEPEAIVDLRLRGMSWYDITVHFGLGSEIYYYNPVRGVPGWSPYGRAFAAYKQHPKKQWRQMRLGDGDIVNLVNLRFVAEHGRMNATEVIQAREGGRSFTTIFSGSRGGRGQDRAPVSWGSGNRGGGQRPGPGQRQEQGRGKGNGKR